MERKIKRGDIYYANLNPVIGSEQGGTRPVLIISNDVGNKHSPTVIILFEQIRTIDKQRLRKYVGMLSTVIMARADKALAISISLREVNNE